MHAASADTGMSVVTPATREPPVDAERRSPRRRARSQNSDDRCVGELALGAGQGFRHGAVPGQLSATKR